MRGCCHVCYVINSRPRISRLRQWTAEVESGLQHRRGTSGQSHSPRGCHEQQRQARELGQVRHFMRSLIRTRTLSDSACKQQLTGIFQARTQRLSMVERGSARRSPQPREHLGRQLQCRHPVSPGHHLGRRVRRRPNRADRRSNQHRGPRLGEQRPVPPGFLDARRQPIPGPAMGSWP